MDRTSGQSQNPGINRPDYGSVGFQGCSGAGTPGLVGWFPHRQRSVWHAQPTTSRKVSELEAELGVQQLQHTTRPLSCKGLWRAASLQGARSTTKPLATRSIACETISAVTERQFDNFWGCPLCAHKPNSLYSKSCEIAKDLKGFYPH